MANNEKVLVTKSKLDTINDTISAKTGVSIRRSLDTMVTDIASISGGGSGIDSKESFNQMNDILSAFLADTTYQNQTYDDTNVNAINFTTSVMADTYRALAVAAATSANPYRADQPMTKSITVNDVTTSTEFSVIDNKDKCMNYLIPQWVSPGYEVNRYKTGDLVFYNGNIYESLIDSNNASPLNNPTKWELKSSAFSMNYIFSNTTPNVDAYYVNNTPTGIIQCGSENATVVGSTYSSLVNNQIRMIYTTSVSVYYCSANTRDLGGWACNGGRVKYGKIIRGMRFSGFTDSRIKISEHDIKVFHDLLGIRSEFDLRKDSEVTYTNGKSGFGDDVAWHHYVLNDSGGSIYNINSTSTSDELKTTMKNIFKQLAYDVSHDNPIFMHCMAGCDRTGVICAIIEGLLGVARYNIDKDYEMSSLVNYLYPVGHSQAGSVNDDYVRYRNRTSSSQPTWRTLIINFNTYAPSGTFEEKVINYLLYLGLTYKEINTIRQNMIDGTPSVIPGYDIEYELENVTSSNNKVTAAPNSAYSATITPAYGYDTPDITVEMGGTDITSTAVSGNTITIAAVTGDIVISAVSEPITYSVTNTLTHVINSNNAASVEYGHPYTATITPDSGYMIIDGDYSVSVGGVNITSLPGMVSRDNDNLIINVPSVTGAIVVEVTAVDASTTCQVSITKSHASSSNPDTVVSIGTSYSTVLTPDSMYIFNASGQTGVVTASMLGGGTISCSTPDPITHAVTVTASPVTGDITITANAAENFYTVTYTLGDKLGSSNASTQVLKNGSYSTVVTPITGCYYDALSPVACTMGGSTVSVTDGTGADVGKKMIDIATVTGNIEITGSASYVDIVASPFFAHGVYYNAMGYANGYRLKDAGGYDNDSAATGYLSVGQDVTAGAATTEYIPIEDGDVFTFDDAIIHPSGTSGTKCKICYYDANKTMVQRFLKLTSAQTYAANTYYKYEDNEFVLLTSSVAPDDWSTYTNYYKKSAGIAFNLRLGSTTSSQGHIDGLYVTTPISSTKFTAEMTLGKYTTTSNTYYLKGYPEPPSTPDTIAPAKYIRVTVSVDNNGTALIPSIYLNKPLS